MKLVKNQKYETFYRSSTLPKGAIASLGTIEKDACSYFGSHDKQLFRGEKSLKKIIKNIDFNSVLDIGAGQCKQTFFFKGQGKQVFTCDLVRNDGPHCDNKINNYNFNGNFLDIDFDGKKFDFVFASHVLEHQRNVGSFIDKMISVTRDNGYLCIIVPIRKPFIVGGHLSIWNPGLLLYNLVSSGIDCSECYIEQHDYDISFIVKLNKFNISDKLLFYDRGDIDILKNYFPFGVQEPFNGDFMYCNTLFNE